MLFPGPITPDRSIPINPAGIALLWIGGVAVTIGLIKMALNGTLLSEAFACPRREPICPSAADPAPPRAKPATTTASPRKARS